MTQNWTAQRVYTQENSDGNAAGASGSLLRVHKVYNKLLVPRYSLAAKKPAVPSSYTLGAVLINLRRWLLSYPGKWLPRINHHVIGSAGVITKCSRWLWFGTHVHIMVVSMYCKQNMMCHVWSSLPKIIMDKGDTIIFRSNCGDTVPVHLLAIADSQLPFTTMTKHEPWAYDIVGDDWWWSLLLVGNWWIISQLVNKYSLPITIHHL